MSPDDCARLIRCEKCKAMPGFYCRTSTGAIATYSHAARNDVVNEIWANGYLDGEKSVWWLVERFERDYGLDYPNHVAMLKGIAQSLVPADG